MAAAVRPAGGAADSWRVEMRELLREVGPSPLEHWELPGAAQLGPSLWVKRDDLLGAGGTKVRKLQVELARARAVGRGLLTVGHLDSNHALTTARLGAVLGLPLELAVYGDPALDPHRAAILRAAAARVSFHRSTAGLVGHIARRCALPPFRRFLPPGGTTAASTAAVALAVGELAEQFGAGGAAMPQRWAVAVGSGGTLAGLWAGIRALGLTARPVGFACSSRWVGPGLVAALANRALALLGSAARLRAREVEVEWGSLGGGHGRQTAASRAAGETFGKLGLPLDPVYTAKVVAGMQSQGAANGEWLLWHTGQAVQLSAL